MQYDNKYDIDHNDCPEYETDVPEEFASDFIVETDTDGYDEFPQSPDEFIGNKFGSDEQAATTDLSDLYQNKDNNYDSDNDNDSPKPCDGDSCNFDYETANDYEVSDPADEQAATNDDWCHCGDSCGCDESARQKFQLDDYEIISDVLGSEKEIVRLYSSALCETAEENLRDIIRENFTEAAADQYKAFSYMQENGMYKTEQASEAKITEAKQQFAPLCNNDSCNY